MTTLAEPAVLAAAKDTLYPDLSSHPNQYAITESQFTVDSWGTWSIPSDIHERLKPFNSVQLASGEPALLGVGMPDGEVLNGDAASTPVVAVEAKGYRQNSGTVGVARGIEQAHSRLPEVNLGYVAAPAASVTETARSLARELNIGIVGVEDSASAAILEPARVTGAGEFSTGVEAIRFQARTHQLTAGSFPVNHPKNFLGYALALAADGDTEETYAEHVIRLASDGRRGAILLGLVDAQTEELTHLGAEVVRFAQAECGSVQAALETFDRWTGKRTRFTELAPRWAQLAQSVTMQYEPTQLIVEALEALHRNGVSEPTLQQLVEQAAAINQPLAIEVFITQDARGAVLTNDGNLDTSVLDDPAVYKSGVYFQFKAQLYHVGLLTTGGTDDKEDALRDAWQLEHTVGLQ
jgi:hypothetical protein